MSFDRNKIDPRAYAEPCGCGSPAGDDCPHTPIRCKHEWEYNNNHGMERTVLQPARKCRWCHLTERGAFRWDHASMSDEDIVSNFPSARP